MINDRKIPLTIPEFSNIFKYKITSIQQSPLAKKIISSVKNELDIDVLACYVNSMRQGEWNRKYSCRYAIQKKKHYSVADILYIDIYYKGHSSQDLVTQKNILNIFLREFNNFDIKIEYPRIFFPDEVEYYKSIFSSFDEENNIIELVPEKDIDKKSFIRLHSFENEITSLILWHTIPQVENFIKRIFGVNVYVLLSYEKKQIVPYHKICFVSYVDKKNFESYNQEEVICKLTNFIKHYDVWNLIQEYKPVFCCWSEVSKKEKFNYHR